MILETENAVNSRRVRSTSPLDLSPLVAPSHPRGLAARPKIESFMDGLGPLDEPARRALASLVMKRGDAQVAAEVGLARATVARASCGLGVYPSTRHAVADYLARVA